VISVAKKRTASGFKKGKHGSKRDIFEDIDEESIREDIRKSVHGKAENKSSILPYVILVLVIAAIIGGGFLIAFVLDHDEDTPGSSSEKTSDEIYGVSLKIVTKQGGDGNHKPYDYSIHKVDPSLGTDYLLLIKNRGNAVDSFRFTSDAPSDWIVDFHGGNELPDVPAGEWHYKALTIRVNTGSGDVSRDIKITVTSRSDSSKYATVTTKNTVVALAPEEADLNKYNAKVDYNLVYYGGGKEDNQNGWYHNQGSEFEASSVIEGFEDAVLGMRVGQTKVVEVPPEKGYGPEDEKHVGGRPLIFEITMLDVNSED